MILKPLWQEFYDTGEGAAAWPTILPIFHLLLETGLFHSLLDLIYTFLYSIEQQRFLT